MFSTIEYNIDYIEIKDNSNHPKPQLVFSSWGYFFPHSAIALAISCGVMLVKYGVVSIV